jgi:peptidyl-prolyl cis-trans isomerase D
VLRAASIQAGTTRPLEAVREELRLEIAAEKAADTAFERSAAIQDALASGATLAEIAERLGMRFLAIRIDAQGRDADGREVALPIAVAARPALLQEIFQTAQGAAPRLTEGEFGFAAMELRSVTPAALRPLESIRAQVNEAFLADARRRFQEQRAAAILAATRAGKPLAEAVAEAGARIEELGPFGREAGGGNPIPRELLPPIFELRLNEVSMIPAPLSFAVVQLIAITRSGLEGQEAALTTLRNETATALAGDLEAQFGAALRARSDVRFNLRLMNALSAE